VSAPKTFSKYEGLGNDFVVIDVGDDREVTHDDAVRLCDRHFGIGADGVLMVLPPRSSGSAARMRVINADGSVPEMCGNGLRCVAHHVALARGTPQAVLSIDTDAGVRECTVDSRGADTEVLVDMGTVRVTGKKVLDIDGRTLSLDVVDAGNPHAVVFGHFLRSEIDRLGPRVENHEAFPNRTNVEFAQLSSRGIDLTVWERGVGVTLACGTGACATAAVAVSVGWIEPGAAVAVYLPGGKLTITVNAAGTTLMRGPSRCVYSGAIAP
jgi:diaminopimelate epimerase